MDRQFWQRKWENSEIGFHESAANPLLLRYGERLAPRAGSRVFVPLCGKTLDIAWLLSTGRQVAGIEFSAIAVDQLFESLALTPAKTRIGELVCYSAGAIDIFVGDVFDLTRAVLGPVDAVYDRAALVALPAALRARYAAHLVALTAGAPQLLVCYEYDQSLMAGPPFSVVDDDVAQLYAHAYALTLLERAPVAGGFKGRFPARENVWLLT